MGILVDENTRVIVQGITGRQGRFHTELMLKYGTKIVAGVTPGKSGMEVHGIPVYDTMREALSEHSADTSIVFVPAKFAFEAVVEAIYSGIKKVVVITEHVPVHDSLKIISLAKRANTIIIGPNTPGVISPGKCKVGIMPGNVFNPGRIGLISRSGTLTYEIAMNLTNAGFGQSTCIGIGGDPVVGLTFIDVMELFRSDNETDALVIIGEIGGDAEERAAKYIKETNYPKPVVAFIAGRTAPPGKRMGHAGAIISGSSGTAESKIKAFNRVGVPVAKKPSEIPILLREILRA
ncbi:MAG: succinate--CoA ligase subunit alpha [archaeon GB-1867-097]|nr:succinate--CoA ligase subunit alpha [Candidatus Culexmicrobium thermophilum]MCS7384304.1 succinate--CoA ligase subunit alpha [Candidatus Culexmicrobium thermophilum]HDO21055.1 succinate--CoA ligase subunit alpha [Candidatus Bathyarchaeota archaeon]